MQSTSWNLYTAFYFDTNATYETNLLLKNLPYCNVQVMERNYSSGQKKYFNMELYEMWKFESGEASNKSLLKNFHSAIEFVRICLN